MKPAPTPHGPGDTEVEKFDNAVCRIFNASKEEIDRHAKERKRIQAGKKPTKKTA